MDILNSYTTLNNSRPIIQGKKLTRYRNNIIYTIGFDLSHNIEIGPLMLDKSVKPAISNNICSKLVIQICEAMKVYLSYNDYLPVMNPITKTGFWRHIQIRENMNSEYILNFRVNKNEEYIEIFQKQSNRLVSFFQKHIQDNLLQINYQIIEGKREPTVQDKYYTLYHVNDLYVEMLDCMFIIHPLAFFQVNYETAELIFKKVRELVREVSSDKLLDICCGIGVYSFMCRDLFTSTIGIDSNPYNIKTANTLKTINNNSNHCQFYCGKVQDYIDELILNGSYTLILNPGRSGLPLAVCQTIFDNLRLFNQIVYVSCNPQSLKRDLDRFQMHSKYVYDIIPVNQFPNTNEWEVIVNIKLDCENRL